MMMRNFTKQTRQVEHEASSEIQSGSSSERVGEWPSPTPSGARIPPEPGTHSNPEGTTAMLDVHPRHEPVHTCKDFFVHIATITTGLLIAVGIEQTVELVHHRNQARQLEEQMQAVFESNLQSDEDDFKRLANLRASTGNLLCDSQRPMIHDRPV
jgi:hypothetical protein